MTWYFLVSFEISWCPPKQIQLFVGVMVTSARSENHENERLSGLPKMKTKSYQSKTEQNRSTELLGESFPPDNPDPQVCIFPGLIWSSLASPKPVPGATGPPIQSTGPPMRMQGWESVKVDSKNELKRPLISR